MNLRLLSQVSPYEAAEPGGESGRSLSKTRDGSGWCTDSPRSFLTADCDQLKEPKLRALLALLLAKRGPPGREGA